MFPRLAVALGVLWIGLAGGLPGAVDAQALATPAKSRGPLSPPLPILSLPQVVNIATAAQNGISEAQLELGRFYAYGDGVPKERTTAAIWMRKAARQGNRDAMGALFSLYDEGADAPKPDGREPDWLQLAADEGWGAAQDALGRMYADGDGRPRDLIEAYKWLDLAATAPDGRTGNSSVTRRNEIAAKMTPDQIAEAKKRVEEWGLAETTPDQLADQGWVAVRLHKFEQAVALLTPVATDGNARAQFFLGRLYFDSAEAPEDETKAAAWFQRSADQGNVGAQHMIGVMMGSGRGLSQNPKAAADWTRKAAMQGLAVAEDELGQMYHMGFGVPSDDNAAATWTMKAAAQGQGHAQYVLGSFYALGTGVPQDPVEAYKWTDLATKYPSIDSQTQKKAQADIQSMAATMTQDQIAKAIAEVKAWRPVFEVP